MDNPHNYQIEELEAAQLPRSLDSLDIAVINGNYAIDAGLDVADALAIEFLRGHRRHRLCERAGRQGGQ